MAVAALVAAMVTAAEAAPPAAAAEGAFDEYQVKAAFIRNFVKFVEWPSGAPRALTLCILGDDPFRDAFKGRSDLGDGRSLSGRRIGRALEGGECQILFVPPGGRAAIPEIVAALEGKPVLTIGDGEGTATAGLMLGFVNEESKVRFEANLEPVRKSGLVVSSRLLGLAKTVYKAR
jgi:hypothetical protein